MPFSQISFGYPLLIPGRSLLHIHFGHDRFGPDVSRTYITVNDTSQHTPQRALKNPYDSFVFISSNGSEKLSSSSLYRRLHSRATQPAWSDVVIWCPGGFQLGKTTTGRLGRTVCDNSLFIFADSYRRSSTSLKLMKRSNGLETLMNSTR